MFERLLWCRRIEVGVDEHGSCEIVRDESASVKRKSGGSDHRTQKRLDDVGTRLGRIEQEPRGTKSPLLRLGLSDLEIASGEVLLAVVLDALSERGVVVSKPLVEIESIE